MAAPANIEFLNTRLAKAVSMKYERTTLRGVTDEEARSLFNPDPNNYEIVKELTYLSTQKNDGGVWVFKSKGYKNLQYVQNIDRVKAF